MKITKLISSSLILATLLITLAACGRTPPNVLPPIPTDPNNIELPTTSPREAPSFDLELEGTISSPKILTHEYEVKLVTGKKYLLSKKLLSLLNSNSIAAILSPTTTISDSDLLAKIKCQTSCVDSARCINLQFLANDGRFTDLCKTDVDQSNNYNFKILNSSSLEQKILRLTFPNFQNGNRQIIFKFDPLEVSRDKKLLRPINKEDTLRSSLYFYDILNLGNLFDFSLMQLSSEELIKSTLQSTCQNLSEGQIDFIYHQHFETIMSDDHLYTFTQFRLIPSTDVNYFCQRLFLLADSNNNGGDNDSENDGGNDDTPNPDDDGDGDVDPPPVVDTNKTDLKVKHSGLRTRLILCLNVLNKKDHPSTCTPRYPIHYIISIFSFPRSNCIASGAQQNYGLTPEGQLWVKNGCQGLFHYISLDFEQRSPIAISTFKGKTLEPDTLFIQHKAALAPNDNPSIKINNEACIPVVRISDNLFKCTLPELDTGAYPIKIETNHYRYEFQEKFFIKNNS